MGQQRNVPRYYWRSWCHYCSWLVCSFTSFGIPQDVPFNCLSLDGREMDPMIFFLWSFTLCSLFLEQHHTELLDTLQSVLKPAGMAIFMAPLRNNSLINFTKMAKQRNFQVSVEENYDPIIQAQHNQFITNKDLTYTPDIHYPLLVKVCTPSWSVLISHNLIKGQLYLYLEIKIIKVPWRNCLLCIVRSAYGSQRPWLLREPVAQLIPPWSSHCINAK